LKDITIFKKIGTWLTVLVFAILILPLNSMAQEETGSIIGIVYKKDIKTPLKGCQVVLTTLEKDKNKQKQYKSEPSDDNGNYEIKNVPEGIYKAGLIIKSRNKPTKTLTIVKIIQGKTLERSFFYKPRKPLLGYINCVLAVIFFGIVLVI